MVDAFFPFERFFGGFPTYIAWLIWAGASWVLCALGALVVALIVRGIRFLIKR